MSTPKPKQNIIQRRRLLRISDTLNTLVGMESFIKANVEVRDASYRDMCEALRDLEEKLENLK